MSHTMWLLYLIGNADNIISFFCIIGITILIFAILGSVLMASEDRFPKRFAFSSGSIALLFIFIATLFPSSKTLELMVAGDVVVKAAQSEQVQSIAGSSVKILDNYLKDVIKKQEDKNSNK